ncbi:melanocortin-2 receptor accessory protein 2 isoform 1-T1 [Molossus nigricans]
MKVLGSGVFIRAKDRFSALRAFAHVTLINFGVSPSLNGSFMNRSGVRRGKGGVDKHFLCNRVEMSAQRVISNRTSQQSASNSDYTWEYEYYEIGPVSFDGLKAHKYSIVIGFWVGLAVFVIFMFFVLTLLTKTGAPHQDNAESSEKRFRMNSFLSDFGRPLEPDKVFSQQGNEESRSLFHCYINEVGHLEKAKACHQTAALDSDVQLQEVIRSSGQPEEELNRLMKFDIPNFVNTDQNTSFGDDDLLISGPPVVLENKPVSQTSYKDLD